MHKFLFIFLALSLFLYGCEKAEVEANFSVGEVVIVEDSEEVFDDGLDKALEELELIDIENYRNLREFKIKAKQWQFEPAVLEVNKGDYVMLYVISSDDTHSFVLPEYKIDKILEPGMTEIIEFSADKAGTFGFRCSGDCNGGHFEMNGKLIVKE